MHVSYMKLKHLCVIEGLTVYPIGLYDDEEVAQGGFVCCSVVGSNWDHIHRYAPLSDGDEQALLRCHY